MTEILELHPITARIVIDYEKYGDDEECCFEECKEDAKKYKLIEVVYNHSKRWSRVYDFVIQRLSDGKYFKSFYCVGSTESQDESPFEYLDEVELKQVVPVEKTITVYEDLK
jgi:hypothetical protein